MSRFYANLPNLVIALTESVSGTITASLTDAAALTITAPSALTGTVTLQGSLDGGTTWADIGSGGSDVTIGAGNGVTVSPFPYNGLRLSSSTTEAAARTFLVGKSFDVR